jgi:uncharacterized protein YbcC (UPF0753/DUF2309 family)
MNARSRYLVVLWAALLVGCVTSPLQKELTPEQAAAARQALIAWYECIECTDDELEKVLKYGAATEGALIWTLQNGIAPAKQSEIKRQLLDTYKTTKTSMSAEEYVAFYLSNADVTYRSRAATALARLNTPRAKESLKSAANSKEQQPEVRQAIESAVRSERRLNP